jgi:tetratricopeptide (TPR) repeat protein
MAEREEPIEEKGAAATSAGLPRSDQETGRGLPPAAPKEPSYRRPEQAGWARFRQGHVLASRFEVVRLIGRGGMGEVYEVVDQNLQRVHIALKTLLPHIAGDTAMQERLEREVLLARSLAHPHLCPIYDIFRSEDSGEFLLFLTMKLLPGETLTDRLAREPKLTLAEAEAIIRQIASGLSAAHAAGIIHRDIKSSNVLVDGEGAGIHAWITDFGLARLFEGEAAILSTVGAGTPGYMAPELYRGKAATVVSDVFAFGMVLQEILSKQLEPAPKAWQRLIAGCCESDPAERFGSIEEAMASLDGPGTRTVKRMQGKLSRRRMLALSAGAAAAAAGGGAWFAFEKKHSAGPPLPAKRFVALLAWPQTAKEDEALVATVLDSIGRRLVRAEAYVANLLIISSPFVNTAPKYGASPASAVTLLGANLALAALLTRAKISVTLTLQLVEADTSRVLRRAHASVLADAIGELGQKGANLAAAMLGLPKDISLADPDELQRVPASAYRTYTEAQQLMDQPNDAGLEAAIVKYQDVVNENPHFALGYAQLSLAYTRQYSLHHDAGSLQLADIDADLALQYNPASVSALRAKAQWYLLSGKTDLALSFLAKALKADPENPQVLLSKARAFGYLNRWRDEEQVYRQILKERPNYWPAYNELGWNLSRQARYQEAAQAFQDAAAVAPQVALPMANLGTMYVELGRTADARDAFEDSLKRGPDETAYLGLGDIAFGAKDYRQALLYYGKARDLDPKNDLVWRNLGDTYAMLGKKNQVKDSYAHAAAVLREVLKANPSSGQEWTTLGFYDAKLGNDADAWEDLRQAERRGATDLESQFTKAQALALLGKQEDALQLVLACLDRGLAPVEINLALDLKDVRLDPRYKQAVAKRQSQGSP